MLILNHFPDAAGSSLKFAFAFQVYRHMESFISLHDRTE